MNFSHRMLFSAISMLSPSGEPLSGTSARSLPLKRRAVFRTCWTPWAEPVSSSATKRRRTVRRGRRPSSLREAAAKTEATRLCWLSSTPRPIRRSPSTTMAYGSDFHKRASPGGTMSMCVMIQNVPCSSAPGMVTMMLGRSPRDTRLSGAGTLLARTQAQPLQPGDKDLRLLAILRLRRSAGPGPALRSARAAARSWPPVSR